MAFFLVFSSGLWAAQAEKKATDPNDLLKQDISQLEKTPDDQGLRTKIVQLGSQIKPPLEVPKDAKSHFNKAYFLGQGAKSSKDYDLAIAEYRKALEMAPWWAAAYYHLGTAYEKAGMYDQAISSFKIYLASNPKHSGGREAEDKIQYIETLKKQQH